MSERVVVAGASGLIGSALVRALEARGDEVVTLVRRAPEVAPRSRVPREVEWYPERGELDPAHLKGARAVVVLNGASVGRMPWTAWYRRELRNSRLDATRTVVRALIELAGPGSGAGVGREPGAGVVAGAGAGAAVSGARPPRPSVPMLVSASAVGYYGSAPGRVVTEADPQGDTFLAWLCGEWEAAAREAEAVTPVALVRTAPVIHRRGVLKPMITLTSLGLGGPLGRGTQVWPWVSLDDEVSAILHIMDSGLTGPVNVCGPSLASANEIGRALAREMRRPFWLPAPAWGLRLALGRDATESLLTVDAKVRPEALLASGFEFRYETAEAAVRAALA